MIQTLESGGGYTLGFRVDPAARLVDVYKELDSLFSVYSATPIFGVTFERREVKSFINSISNSEYKIIFIELTFNNRKHPNVMMIQFQLIKLLKLTNQKLMKSIQNSPLIWPKAQKVVVDLHFIAKNLVSLWKKLKTDSH